VKKNKLLSMIVIILLIAGVLLAGCAGDGAPPLAQQEEEEEEEEEEEVFNLTFGVWDPPEIPMMRVVQASWAKWIEQESNGRIKITFLYSETVAKAPELADACAAGMCDIVWESAGMVPERWKINELVVQPLMFKFPGSMNAALTAYEMYQNPKYQAYYDSEWPGLKVVGFHANSPSHINTREKQVKVLEDLKGQIISMNQKYIADALGFTAESLTPGERYDALAKGVIDGTLHEFEGHWVWNHYELCKYTTEVGVNVTANFVHLMNIDTWNSLPSDLQALFQGENMKLVSYINGYNFDRDDATFRESIRQYRLDRGIPEGGLYVLPDEERQRWIDACTPLLDAWIVAATAKGAPGQEMFDDARIIIDRLEQQSPDEKCPWCEDWFKEMGADGY